jgi:hypothetical protein
MVRRHSLELHWADVSTVCIGKYVGLDESTAESGVFLSACGVSVDSTNATSVPKISAGY